MSAENIFNNPPAPFESEPEPSIWEEYEADWVKEKIRSASEKDVVVRNALIQLEEQQEKLDSLMAAAMEEGTEYEHNEDLIGNLLAWARTHGRITPTEADEIAHWHRVPEEV